MDRSVTEAQSRYALRLLAEYQDSWDASVLSPINELMTTKFDEDVFAMSSVGGSQMSPEDKALFVLVMSNVLSKDEARRIRSLRNELRKQ